MKVYLKTIFTSPNELLYVAAQILELRDLIDRVIVVEPGFTHIGRVRPLIGIDRLRRLLPDESDKIDYLPVFDHPKIIRNATSDHEAHVNETITRGCFVDHFSLSPKDVVISTDADEVLYRKSAEQAVQHTASSIIAWKAVTLRLHQFMLKDSLLATGFKFFGPSIIGAGRYLGRPRYANWRYAGKSINSASGCHFSWCMPEEDLLLKVKSFAHAHEYTSLGTSPQELIRRSISERRYLFRKPPIDLSDCQHPESLWPLGYTKAKQLLNAERLIS